MRPIRVFSIVASLIAIAATAGAAPINVAQGKAVTITGNIGEITVAGWGNAVSHPPAPLSSLVDGVSVAEGTMWQEGTVWWDEGHAGSFDNRVEIDLDGRFLISLLSIQADNNDFYEISVRNRFGVWSVLGSAPAVFGAGMRTRVGNYALSPFEATAFRINAHDGDSLYSLSEFQATGQAVPEPASLLLFGTGVLGLIGRRGLRK